MVGRGRWMLASAWFPPYQSITLAFVATPRAISREGSSRVKTAFWSWSQAAASAHSGWDGCPGLEEGNRQGTTEAPTAGTHT